MTRETEPPIEELVEHDGAYPCPACAVDPLPSMDAWTDHVYNAHDPTRLWLKVWTGLGALPP